jgi:hypothetical protein
VGAEEKGTIAFYVSHASQYGRAELRFRAETAEGTRLTESSTFKGDALFGPNPRDPDHQRALADLLSRLASLGWTTDGSRPDPWYAWKLRRGPG